MGKPNLFRLVGALTRERPELEAACNNALLGYEGREPSQRFVAAVYMAREGTWRPLENLLQRTELEEVKTNCEQQDLARTKNDCFESSYVRQSLFFIEKVEGSDFAKNLQNCIFNADKYEEILAGLERIEFWGLNSSSELQMRALSEEYSWNPSVLTKLGALRRMFKNVNTIERQRSFYESLMFYKKRFSEI